MKIRAFTLGYPALPDIVWDRKKKYLYIAFLGVLVFDYQGAKNNA